MFLYDFSADGRCPPGESSPIIPYLTMWWSFPLDSFNLHSSTLATPGMDLYKEYAENFQIMHDGWKLWENGGQNIEGLWD